VWTVLALDTVSPPKVAVANGAAANTMLTIATTANRLFLIADLLDRRPGCLPATGRIVEKSGDFSEVRHTGSMIFATRNL
jgi:hypothetical protein